VNKAQLVEAIEDNLGGRKAATDAVNAVLDAIVRAVVSGDRVSITGFGTFEKLDRPAHTARNPQTGEQMRVKRTSVPRFRAGQGFKDLVGGSKKLPKTGVSVKKAPKDSLTPGKTGMVAPASSPPAKKATKRVTGSGGAKKAAAKKSAVMDTGSGGAKKAAAKKSAKKATGSGGVKA
jgi:DNA-binding protein HU-beta